MEPLRHPRIRAGLSGKREGANSLSCLRERVGVRAEELFNLLPEL
jgi:hypothetical protein